MNQKSNIKLAFFLNLFFTIIEIIGGMITNSIALISDAIHDLGDSLSLGVSWYLESVSKKKPNSKYTFGYARFSVLGGLITSIVLVVGIVFIAIEAVKRIINPEPVNAPIVLLFAIFGILVNGYAAYKTSKGSSINERVISLHLLEDVLGWAVLLIVSIIMSIWELPILDPILSIVYGLFILFHVLKNLKEIGLIFLEGYKKPIDIEALKKAIDEPLILDLHHLHYWTLDGNQNHVTLHALMDPKVTPIEHTRLIHKIKHTLEHMGFNHITIETEFDPCPDGNCHPVVSEQHNHHHHH